VIAGEAHHLVDLHRLRGGRWVTVTVEGTSLDALMVEDLGQRVAIRVAEGIGSDILWQLDDESIRLIDTTPRMVAKRALRVSGLGDLRRGSRARHSGSAIVGGV
jgi:hypothetical protein